MRQRLMIIILSMGICFSYGQSISSSVIATSGGSAEAGGISLSWTLGEVAVETFTSSNLILTQGFQQGYYEITSINDPLTQPMDLVIYPNPAIDYITIEVKNPEFKSIKLELYSIDGKLITNEQWNNTGTPYMFQINRFNASQYILKVIDLDTKITSTFKIIKR